MPFDESTFKGLIPFLIFVGFIIGVIVAAIIGSILVVAL